MEELENLISDYLKQYPKAENPLSFWSAYGDDMLIEILKDRQGRKIIFTEGSGEDEVTFTYAKQ